jgi:hypothetical protein
MNKIQRYEHAWQQYLHVIYPCIWHLNLQTCVQGCSGRLQCDSIPVLPEIMDHLMELLLTETNF